MFADVPSIHLSDAQALSLINFLLFNGSPQVFNYCHQNLYLFKTLREFQYIDDNGSDVGMNVRTEAKEITRLLVNPEALRRGRTNGRRSFEEIVSERSPQGRRSSEEEDAKRRQQERREKRQSSEDKDVARAIELSKEEEARRLRAIEKSNAGGIFNDLEECASLSYRVFLVDSSFLDSPNKKSSDLIDLSDISIPAAPLQVQYTQMPVQQQYTAYPLQQQYTSMPMQQQYTAYSGFQVDPQYTYGIQQEAMQVSLAFCRVFFVFSFRSAPRTQKASMLAMRAPKSICTTSALAFIASRKLVECFICCFLLTVELAILSALSACSSRADMWHLCRPNTSVSKLSGRLMRSKPRHKHKPRRRHKPKCSKCKLRGNRCNSKPLHRNRRRSGPYIFCLVSCRVLTGVQITTSRSSNNPFAPGPSPSPSLSISSAGTSITTDSSSSYMSPATPFSARSMSRGTPSVHDERHAQLAGLFAGRSAGDDGVDTFGNIGTLRYVVILVKPRTSSPNSCGVGLGRLRTRPVSLAVEIRPSSPHSEPLSSRLVVGVQAPNQNCHASLMILTS